LDVFLEAPDLTGPVGLLTNAASLTRDRRTAFRALCEAGAGITAVFTPEHGYYGIGAADGTLEAAYLGSVPVYNLALHMEAPALEALSKLKLLLIDLQDTGTRWHTSLTTVQHMLHACAAANVPALLLDRPNPQGGIVVEGARAEPGFFSTVAPAALPIRYGLTIGEVAQWMNASIGAQLDVVLMEGWQRDMLFADTGLLWSAPSPGVPHPLTALLHTATCLIGGMALSDGRGTALPFEQIGAPFVVGEVLAEELNDLELPGVAFIPTWFRPATSQYIGETCEGVRICITEPRQFHGVSVGLHIIEMLRRLYPVESQWLWYSKLNLFDQLVANTFVRHELEEGHSAADISKKCQEDALAFQAETTMFWLYE
jgi:uncharacterized protein YbbC (DUF1343 family)